MNHNLIPSFILSKGGMVVNNMPKIHHPTGLPSLEDYSFGDKKTDLLVTFRLSGMFSISIF